MPALAQKQLVGIPWRVAFALQADGWYLRSDIIWSKPNPMPESVTDRPTKSHEYLFLLSKSPRYYFDADAVREDAIRSGDLPGGHHERGAAFVADGANDGRTHAGLRELGRQPVAAGRNIRSVWTVATQPYPGAHFATFPEKLIEPCIKAGSSERGVCSECGAPWVRQTVVTSNRAEAMKWDTPKRDEAFAQSRYTGGLRNTNGQTLTRTVETTGWRSSCAHDAPTVPAVILDPFAGSGTTGRVAQRLGRRAVLIDLNGDYLVQAMARNQDIPLGLETA